MGLKLDSKYKMCGKRIVLYGFENAILYLSDAENIPNGWGPRSMYRATSSVKFYKELTSW